MDCPNCGGGTRVLETDPYPDRVRRRRQCEECDHRFTTNEEPRLTEEVWAHLARRHINDALEGINAARGPAKAFGSGEVLGELATAARSLRKARQRLEPQVREA